MLIETAKEIIKNRVRVYLENLKETSSTTLSVSELVDYILDIDITGSDETLEEILEMMLKPGANWPDIVA